jgi:hypothetical protein
MISLEKIPIPNPAVVGRIVNNEAVLVIPVKGQVKVLNEVGARIWSLIDGSRTVGEIKTIIETEYAVSAEDALNDTSIFINQLAEREIIIFSEGAQVRRT